jgi:hypothetical protein
VPGKGDPGLYYPEVVESGEHLQIIEKVAAGYPNPGNPETGHSGEDGVWFVRDKL